MEKNKLDYMSYLVIVPKLISWKVGYSIQVDQPFTAVFIPPGRNRIFLAIFIKSRISQTNGLQKSQQKWYAWSRATHQMNI